MRHTLSLSQGAIGSVIVLAAASVVQGRQDEVCYRIHDLGPRNPPADGSLGNIEKPIRINELGDIVFTAGDEPGGSGSLRGYLWLPEDRYGLAALARHDLSALIGPSTPSAATDLNNAPDDLLTVVGGRNAGAYVWQFGASGLVDHDFLRNRVLGLAAESIAYGVTDYAGIDEQDPRPFITGVFQITLCAESSDQAFRALWNSNAGVEQLLPPLSPGWSVAVDVARRGEPLAPGFARECAADVGPCGVGLLPVAMVWDTVDPTSADMIPTPGVEAEARGINLSGHIAGLLQVHEPPPIGNCFQRAVFWESRTSQPVELPEEPGGNPDHQRRAEAVSNADPVTGEVVVVGDNQSLERALAWRGSPSAGWEAIDLTLALSNCCGDADGWLKLDRAFDVTEDGRIVGFGTRQNLEQHYFLLTPNLNCDCCPGDHNGDGVVDVLDLVAVLGTWGSCPGCPEDFNCDNVVDVLDLLIVLGEWGPCEEGAPVGMGMTLEEALGVMGFSTVQEFRTWASGASQSEVPAMGELLHLFISPEQGGQN